MERTKARAVQRSIAFAGLATALGLPAAAAYAWAAHGGPSWLAVVGAVAYMFTPLLAAAAFTWRDGERLRDRVALRFTRRWAWLAAVVVPLVVSIGALGVSVALPGVSFDPGMSGLLAQLDGPTRALAESQIADLPGPGVLIPLVLLQAAIAGCTLNAIPAFGEEAGWRGWMHEELAPLGFWPRVGVTGVLWGLWHAPLILQGHNYPQHPVLGVAFMVAMCVGLSGPMALVRERTESAVAAAMFHGVFNAAAGLTAMYVVGGNDLLVGVTGLAGLLVLAAVNVVVAWMR